MQMNYFVLYFRPIFSPDWVKSFPEIFRGAFAPKLLDVPVMSNCLRFAVRTLETPKCRQLL